MSVGMFDDSFMWGCLITHSRPVLDCVDGYECGDV